ncbi:KilA-N domain-containing protein [Acetobacter sp.]|uniref:KilA-N domain-containing protein n=1 Tax=Acetobacter sp. TaxID=440 RepID=UPI00258F5419|nr:KilA-N domain-containing protein [Acetobacter sp.]MCC6106120.1 KilA-N domain-containing protein [Acetobacter sp.]
MPNSNTNLTILSTTIRQDAEGRYCLNDCHKASGGDATKAPAQWLRNDQTKALIGELSDVEICTSPVSTKKGGTNQGTYACKELVYAYAMWISPAFHLTVIRAFDALVTGQIPNAAPKPKRIRKPSFAVTFDRCLRVAAHLPNVDENQKVLMAARGTYNLTGVNPLEVMGYASLPAPTQDNYLTPTELGLQVGLSAVRVNRILAEEARLQIAMPGSSSGSKWAMTERGLAYGKMFDTTRKGGRGSQQQLKWKPSVVEFLRPFAAPSA